MNTKILDSNIFLRYFTSDITAQYKKVKEFIQQVEAGKAEGLISILVIDEVVWALKNYYGLERKAFIPKILEVLLLPGLKIIEVKKDIILTVLGAMIDSKIDFTDYYLAAISKETPIFSFDRDFKKLLFRPIERKREEIE